MDLRATVSRLLERGDALPATGGVVGDVLSAAWGTVAAHRLARPLAWPGNVSLVAVGGATLGGSGKTPLAVACARVLATRGKVALIGHAYRARPASARVVTVDDDVGAVGDEALACTGDLAATDVDVIVAPSRQLAVDLAVARGARWIVVDGVLATTPRAPDLALLAVDAASPWGSGRCPPCGDLRAPREALRAAADEIVAIDLTMQTSRGARAPGSGAPTPLAELAANAPRIGVATALARPDRLVGWLRAQGVRPTVVVCASDHGRPILPRDAAVDLWLMTAKCAAHLTAAERAERRVHVIDHALDLPENVVVRLHTLSEPRRADQTF